MRLTFTLLAVALFFFASELKAQETAKKPLSKLVAIEKAVQQLLSIQNDDGAWPYEGVYRVNRRIPVGYRIGGTAICCEALLYSPQTPATTKAISRGVKMILKELEHPQMKPGKIARYDVRVWGHIYSLDLFCRIIAEKRLPEQAAEIQKWIDALTKALLTEEIETGGWNYANRRAHAGFVTAPAVQALMLARENGQKISDKVWKRAAESMLRSRNQLGAYSYSGNERKRRPTKLPGAIARAANCEATLHLLGQRRLGAIQQALDAFHQHWDELEKRRKKNGTHLPPYGIAPYYFYYAHRYAALAIGQLPQQQRAKEYQKLYDRLLMTRDDDGTWNDRVFARSRAYGTAMSILALLEDEVPSPKTFKRQVSLLENSQGDPIPMVDPSLTPPDWKLRMDAAGKITIGAQATTINELEAWIKANPPQRNPLVVLLEVSGNAKSGELERVKRIVGKAFKPGKLFVGVWEDSDK